MAASGHGVSQHPCVGNLLRAIRQTKNTDSIQVFSDRPAYPPDCSAWQNTEQTFSLLPGRAERLYGFANLGQGLNVRGAEPSCDTPSSTAVESVEILSRAAL